MEGVRLRAAIPTAGVSSARATVGTGLNVVGEWVIPTYVYWGNMYLLDDPGGRFISVGGPFGNNTAGADTMGITLWHIVDEVPTPITTVGCGLTGSPPIKRWDALNEARTQWVFADTGGGAIRTRFMSIVGDTIVLGATSSTVIAESLRAVVGLSATSAVVVTVEGLSSSADDILKFRAFNPQSPVLGAPTSYTIASTFAPSDGFLSAYGGRRADDEGVVVLTVAQLSGPGPSDTTPGSETSWVLRVNAGGIVSSVAAGDELVSYLHPGSNDVLYTGQGYEDENFFRVTDAATVSIAQPAPDPGGESIIGDSDFETPLPYDHDHVSFVWQKEATAIRLEERDTATFAVTSLLQANTVNGFPITEAGLADPEAEEIAANFLVADYAQIDAAAWVTRLFGTETALLVRLTGAASHGESTAVAQTARAFRPARLVKATPQSVVLAS